MIKVDLISCFIHFNWTSVLVVEQYFDNPPSCLLTLLPLLLTRNFAGGLPPTPVTALHAIVMLIRNSRAFSPPAASEKSGQKTPGPSPAGRGPFAAGVNGAALLIR